MPKLLTNVFRCAGGNRLQAVDILFDERIIEIRPIHQVSLEWLDIAKSEAWEKIKQRLFIERVAPKSIQVNDGRGLLVIPGSIDAHVHFNTPGYENREDFEHGSKAAAHSGVTTVIDMPCTSVPPVTSAKNMAHKISALKGRSFIDFALWGGIRGNDFDETDLLQKQIKELSKAGVVGFKAYLTSGMDTFTHLSPGQMTKAAVWLQESGLPLAVHAEDYELVSGRKKFYQKKGRHDWQAYCSSRDTEAEVLAIKTIGQISEQTGVRAHIVHLSSGDGLQLVRKFQSNGVLITAETCPHYLYFIQKDFENSKISAYLKTAPPVKFGEDRALLWSGLSDGTIAFVTTDHAGCDPLLEKSNANFWEIYGGIPGVQHRVPFLFSEGFKKERLTLEQTIQLLSSNVADFFRLADKGHLSHGKDADFALVNLWQSGAVHSSEMLSKGKYTPFEGLTLDAVVEQTWLRGRKIMDRSGMPEPTNPGYGKFIPRSI